MAKPVPMAPPVIPFFLLFNFFMLITLNHDFSRCLVTYRPFRQTGISTPVSPALASGDLTVTIEKKTSDTAGILETSFETMFRDLRDALAPENVNMKSTVQGSRNLFRP